MRERMKQWKHEADVVSRILAKSPRIDKSRRIGREEFQGRQKKVISALSEAGIDAAFVYSDEHYNGDVPYLAGNTNISIEPVAGVIGSLSVDPRDIVIRNQELMTVIDLSAFEIEISIPETFADDIWPCSTRN